MIFWLNVDIRHFRGKFALPADMTRPTFFAAKPQQLPPHLYFAAHPPSIYSPHQQPMNIEYYGYAIPTPSPTRTPSIGSSTLHPHSRRPRSATQQSHHRSRIIVIVMIWSALLHCADSPLIDNPHCILSPLIQQ